MIALSFALASSALTTYLGHRISIVLSSIVATLVLCIFSNYFFPLQEDLQAIIYGSSFVGMTSLVTLKRHHIIFGSILFVVIFSQIERLDLNLGGTQGFSAFLSIVILTLIFKKR